MYLHERSQTLRHSPDISSAEQGIAVQPRKGKPTPPTNPHSRQIPRLPHPQEVLQRVLHRGRRGGLEQRRHRPLLQPAQVGNLQRGKGNLDTSTGTAACPASGSCSCTREEAKPPGSVGIFRWSIQVRPQNSTRLSRVSFCSSTHLGLRWPQIPTCHAAATPAPSCVLPSPSLNLPQEPAPPTLRFLGRGKLKPSQPDNHGITWAGKALPAHGAQSPPCHLAPTHGFIPWPQQLQAEHEERLFLHTGKEPGAPSSSAQGCSAIPTVNYPSYNLCTVAPFPTKRFPMAQTEQQLQTLIPFFRL